MVTKQASQGGLEQVAELPTERTNPGTGGHRRAAGTPKPVVMHQRNPETGGHRFAAARFRAAAGRLNTGSLAVVSTGASSLKCSPQSPERLE